jgi:hypothetical protein
MEKRFKLPWWQLEAVLKESKLLPPIATITNLTLVHPKELLVTAEIKTK